MAKPFLVTRQSLARGVAAKWKHQRSCNGHWTLHRKEEERDIYEKLLELGPDPDPDAADKIIGNGSWTDPGRCVGCDLDDGGPRVVIGEEPDYESATATMCGACLNEAAALLHKGDPR